MIKYISNTDHYKDVLSRVQSVKHMLWIGTADIKDMYIEVGKDKKPFLALIAQLIRRSVEVRLILVFDGKEVYIGSANLTGAGIGMKTDNKRNFEAGFLTDDTEIVELQKQYSYIAEHAFFGGYFEVNNKRRIYPTDIEFYYHEEDADGLKDPIMYHTDDHEKKKLEYYPLSSLNFHMSGLDVTFENKKMNYRASFLIREYKVCDFNGKDWVETKGNENRSTYIYEDMLMNIPLSEGVNIRWIDSPSEKEASWEPVVSSRINVANYVTDTEGSYIKEEIDKNAFDQLPLEEQKKYFSYSGKKFKRCNRMWNFHK